MCYNGTFELEGMSSYIDIMGQGVGDWRGGGGIVYKSTFFNYHFMPGTVVLLLGEVVLHGLGKLLLVEAGVHEAGLAEQFEVVVGECLDERVQ